MEIRSGDWIVSPDSVTGWSSQNSVKNHRYLVISIRLGQLIVVARSSDRFSYEGLLHDRHDGCCGETTCKIDLDGRLSGDPVSPIDQRHAAGSRSCHEPDDGVIEWAWDHIPKGRL